MTDPRKQQESQDKLFQHREKVSLDYLVSDLVERRFDQDNVMMVDDALLDETDMDEELIDWEEDLPGDYDEFL